MDIMKSDDHFPSISKASNVYNPYGWDSSKLPLEPNPNATRYYVVMNEMEASNTWMSPRAEWSADPPIKKSDRKILSSMDCHCLKDGSQRCEAHKSADPETCDKIAAHFRQLKERGEKICIKRPPSELDETFVLFNWLPCEIKIQIWEYATEDMLKAKWDRTRKVCVDRHSTEHRLLCHSPLPSLLETCHLSREVALKKYQVAFDTKHSRSRIYFNFKNDILFLCNETYEDLPWMTKNYFPEDFRRIERLRLPLRDLVITRDVRVRNDLFWALTCFPRLVDLRFLVSNSEENKKYWDDERRIAREKSVKSELDWYWRDKYNRKGPRVRITPIRAETASVWGIDNLSYFW